MAMSENQNPDMDPVGSGYTAAEAAIIEFNNTARSLTSTNIVFEGFACRSP